MSLSIGAKVIITWNLDQEADTVNGKKGFVKAIHNNVIILEEEQSKVLIPVTKVKQKIHVSKTGKRRGESAESAVSWRDPHVELLKGSVGPC